MIADLALFLAVLSLVSLVFLALSVPLEVARRSERFGAAMDHLVDWVFR